MIKTICIFLISISAFASQKPHNFSDIKKDYSKLSKDSIKLLGLFYHSRDRQQLKSEIFKRGAKAAPALTTVMKDARFNERNRWTATFLLGRVVGKKSASFISKFTHHPNWIMRLASLKTLTALSEDRLDIYRPLLNDASLIVRIQALDAVGKLKLKPLADDILAMLFKKENYQLIGTNLKRSPLIKKAIMVLGELKHERSIIAFNKLLKKDAYKDIHSELKMALTAMN